MDTVSWLVAMLVVSTIIGTLTYHFGFAMGKEQERLDRKAELQAWARERGLLVHPSGGITHLRVVKPE